MLFKVIAVTSLLWIVTVQATPTGNHTCTGVVKHSVTVRVNVTEPVTYRTYTWCLRVPPRCSKYTVQLKDRIKIHTEMHNRTITVCCKGYVEMDYKCVPACPPQTECPNMHCNRTNHCYCTPGYQGLYCNYPCDRGFWGADCKKSCDCPDGYTCHHLTGDCMLDDRPPPTTKYRRTTTSTVATLSPETTFAETTATTTAQPSTALPTTELTTVRTRETTTVSKTRLSQQSTVPITTKTISLTSEASTITPESVVENGMYTTTSITEQPTTTPHVVNEFVTTINTLNFNVQSTTTKEPPTEETVDSSTTALLTKQSFIPNTASPTTTTTIELPINTIPSISSTTSSTVAEERTTQNTVINTTLDLMDATTLHPIFIGNSSEVSSSSKIFVEPSTVSLTTNSIPASSSVIPITVPPSNTEPTFSTTTSTPPTTLSTGSATVFQSTAETFATTFASPSTLFTVSTAASTIPTTTSTTPTTFEPIKYTTQESVINFDQYISTTQKNNVPVIDTSNTAPPDITSTKSMSSSKKDDLSNANDNIHYMPTNFQTEVPSTQISDVSDSTTKPSKTVLPLGGATELPVTTTVTSISQESLANRETSFISATTLLETLLPVENFERATTVKTTTLSATTKTKTEPSVIDVTTKRNVEAINTLYVNTTESTKLSEIEKNLEEFEGKNVTNTFSNDEFIRVSEKIDSTVVPPLDTTAIMSTSAQSTLSTVTEPTKTIMSEIFSSTISSIDKSVVESEIKRISMGTSKTVTDGYTVSSNDNVPVLEATENSKYEENLKISNAVRKSYKNGTNFISGLNEVSTKFGQTNFEWGKSDSEIKLKQRPEITTSTSKEEASARNLWLTTNSRPAHTWYSHVKEYQRKAKNKEDAKLSKTSHLDLLSVTEKYDISEESNIIDSMQTTFTERGSKGNSGAPPVVNEEANIASTYIKPGQIKYNLSSALAEEVQAGRSDKSLFTLYSTTTLISGIALILLISTSTALWLYLRRKREPTTLRGQCIMAYGSPNSLMYETIYPLDPLEGEQEIDPEIFFCPTFTNNYAEKINRELSELNYDHPRSSICEPLYAEIRY